MFFDPDDPKFVAKTITLIAFLVALLVFFLFLAGPPSCSQT